MVDSANPSVLFEEIHCENKLRIGVITLNVEKTLNALTLTMIELMYARLQLWKEDNDIACVCIKGAGDKAFCAGGDVQALYQSAINTPAGPCEYAENFFNKEYQLDYLLHQFPKPIVCWGDGIVMGGGLGIFAASSHRIVTQKTRLAMPEVTIGLYPDVGGSYFLNKMPGNTGLFLALTGVPINGADSLFTGIADYFIDSHLHSELITALCKLPWCNHSKKNIILLDQLLESLSQKSKNNIPVANIERHQSTINTVCDTGDIYQIAQALGDLESDDKWLLRAQKAFLAGSPISVMVIYQQLQQAKSLSLADIFRSELIVSTNMVRYPDFAEGVRALLIDKDNQPQWQYARLQDIPSRQVEAFFTAPEFPAPWPCHPLENL